MTLPTNTLLPEVNQRVKHGGEELESYLKELTFTLNRQYEEISQAINGDFRRDVDTGSRQWTPLLKDTLNSGTTFTYDHQVGWVLRKGIVVDIFFDIKWSVNSGAITGNMYLELPYKVAITNQKPFIGVLQPSIFAYTGGTECVINAISDTFRGEIWNCGSGFTTANQASVAAGQLIGSLRYIGQGIERT